MLPFSKKLLVHVAVWGFVLLLGLEGGLHLMGWSFAAQTNRPDCLVECKPTSGVGSCFDFNKPVGYSHNPGCHRFLYRGGHSYLACHDEEGWRLPPNQPLDQGSSAKANANDIWVLGCSFAYGTGVSDDEPFPAQLKDLLNGVDVRNLSLPGAGQIFQAKVLEEQLAMGRQPKAVVLTYGSFHDFRNIQSFYYLFINRNLSEQSLKLRWPVATLVDDSLVYGTLDQTSLAWQLATKSSSAYTLAMLYEQMGFRHRYQWAVTKALFALMKARLDQAGIPHLVACYTHDEASLAHMAELKAMGYPVLMLPQLPKAQAWVTEHDAHPSARAHRAYAEALARELGPLLRVEPTAPMP